MEHIQVVADMAAEKYVLGELRNGEREQFEEHYFSCPDCAQDVRDLARLAEGACFVLNRQSGIEPAPRTATAAIGARIRASRWVDLWRLSWLRLEPVSSLAWAGALLALAVFGGYQTLQVRKFTRPQVVTSFLLLPESRGQAAPVPAARIGEFFLLEADLPDSAGSLQWDLRRTDSNRAVANGEAEALAAGASFKVLVPSSVLPPAEYTLAVRPAGGAAKKTRLYRFRIDRILR